LYTGQPDKRIILHGERSAMHQEIMAAMDVEAAAPA
jgi:hypothetical protein